MATHEAVRGSHVGGARHGGKVDAGGRRRGEGRADWGGSEGGRPRRRLPAAAAAGAALVETATCNNAGWQACHPSSMRHHGGRVGRCTARTCRRVVGRAPEGVVTPAIRTALVTIAVRAVRRCPAASAARAAASVRRLHGALRRGGRPADRSRFENGRRVSRRVARRARRCMRAEAAIVGPPHRHVGL